MAVPQAKINKILTAWKLGKFTMYREGGRIYKLSHLTIKKIVSGFENGCDIPLIHQGLAYERAKMKTGDKTTITAVEAEVKEVIDLEKIRNEIEEEVVMGTVETVRAVRAKVKEGTKLYITKDGEEVIPMDMGDYKMAQDTIDKALITAGKADRHAPKAIDVNVNTGIQGNFDFNDGKRPGINDYYADVEDGEIIPEDKQIEQREEAS